MIFIKLCKVRKKLTKESIAEATKVIQRATKEGVKFLNIYYTLGRYDVVTIYEEWL